MSVPRTPGAPGCPRPALTPRSCASCWTTAGVCVEPGAPEPRLQLGRLGAGRPRRATPRDRHTDMADSWQNTPPLHPRHPRGPVTLKSHKGKVTSPANSRVNGEKRPRLGRSSKGHCPRDSREEVVWGQPGVKPARGAHGTEEWARAGRAGARPGALWTKEQDTFPNLRKQRDSRFAPVTFLIASEIPAFCAHRGGLSRPSPSVCLRGAVRGQSTLGIL